ncbi:MAG: YjgP/YjgQ family permease [Armatimonadetes bacterium]|nr:YjgP/YjgQ family permease [Armatimonadota bacterium]
MKLLDRRLLGELLAPFIAGTLVFVAVILVNTIVNNTAAIFTLHAPWQVVLQWLWYRVPIIITYALPVGCMLATSLVVIRLGRDNEITAWRMGGTSIRRLFVPFYLGGLLVSLVALLNNELVAPRYRVKANEVLIKRILQGPGSWVKDDMPFRAGDDTMAHVGRIDLRKREMYFVLIYRLREGVPTEALSAARCVQEAGKWVLREGQHSWFDDRGRLSRLEHFDSSPVEFAPNLALMWEDENEPEQLSAQEIWRRLRLYERAGDIINTIRMRYFLHAKFAVPLTCLIFTLLAAPLSLRFAGRRSHPLAGVMLTIAVVFFTNGTINWAKAIALSGPQAWIPPIVAAWLHVVVFGGLALVLARRAER